MNPLHVAVLSSDAEMVQILSHKVHQNAFYIKPESSYLDTPEEVAENLVNQSQ